jgi:predicted transcriptional regulator with HTH domain
VSSGLVSGRCLRGLGTGSGVEVSMGGFGAVALEVSLELGFEFYREESEGKRVVGMLRTRIWLR